MHSGVVDLTTIPNAPSTNITPLSANRSCFLGGLGQSYYRFTRPFACRDSRSSHPDLNRSIPGLHSEPTGQRQRLSSTRPSCCRSCTSSHDRRAALRIVLKASTSPIRGEFLRLYTRRVLPTVSPIMISSPTRPVKKHDSTLLKLQIFYPKSTPQDRR